MRSEGWCQAVLRNNSSAPEPNHRFRAFFTHYFIGLFGISIDNITTVWKNQSKKLVISKNMFIFAEDTIKHNFRKQDSDIHKMSESCFLKFMFNKSINN